MLLAGIKVKKPIQTVSYALCGEGDAVSANIVADTSCVVFYMNGNLSLGPHLLNTKHASTFIVLTYTKFYSNLKTRTKKLTK